MNMIKLTLKRTFLHAFTCSFFTLTKITIKWFLRNGEVDMTKEWLLIFQIQTVDLGFYVSQLFDESCSGHVCHDTLLIINPSLAE